MIFSAYSCGRVERLVQCTDSKEKFAPFIMIGQIPDDAVIFDEERALIIMGGFQRGSMLFFYVLSRL